ncbi:Achilleol B synthase, partial [Dichanthelium oligosanthes]
LTVLRRALNQHIHEQPMFNQWPLKKLREKTLINLMEHIHYEDENSNYVCLCPVNKVLNMICCWIEKPNSNEFRQHLPRIYDFFGLQRMERRQRYFLFVDLTYVGAKIRPAESGHRTPAEPRGRAVYVGCHTWETVVQAFCSTGLNEVFGTTLRKAHEFIKNAQAILLLSKIPSDLVWDPIKEDRLYDAVDCLLSYVVCLHNCLTFLKNKDDTLSSAECTRTTSWVEVSTGLGPYVSLMGHSLL